MSTETIRIADTAGLLERLLRREDLSQAEAAALMRTLTDESLHPAVGGALLSSLRAKGETPAEVRGFASAMRELARKPRLAAGDACIDSVGTGGDGSGSLNLSTGTALLAAACGLRVVKHGNRSVSSRCGSADVLESLGLTIPLDEDQAGACLAQSGFTFLFAPHYHPAMKAVAPIRRALGVRTVFNLLGPLTNPAAPDFLLIGAYSHAAARLIADTLAGMSVSRAFVIHGDRGWDEPTPIGPFVLYDVRGGEVREERRDPLDYGLARCAPEALAGGDAGQNAARLAAVLRGDEHGAHRDALLLGAALMLEVRGKVGSVQDGIERAAAAIDDGNAVTVLEKLAAFS